jgi:monofunctional biosynthetic peptidoglycan transglycosylase
LHGASTIS